MSKNYLFFTQPARYGRSSAAANAANTGERSESSQLAGVCDWPCYELLVPLQNFTRPPGRVDMKKLRLAGCLVTLH